MAASAAVTEASAAAAEASAAATMVAAEATTTAVEVSVAASGIWVLVQKRGSVGRTIDVTRYRGYDELRHDIACKFGIEELLETTYRTDWKLVYVDHENDVLLVGEDPWEEFVNCVKSIKILSATQVQQMSLDGDMANTRPRTKL